MSLVLNTITSLDKLSLINNNFTKIQNVVNGSVLWREGTDAGYAMMTRDLDMNGYQLLNVVIGDFNLSDLTEELSSALEQAQENEDNSAASAASAASSSEAASVSASQAAISQGEAATSAASIAASAAQIATNTNNISSLTTRMSAEETKVQSVLLGGTGSTTAAGARTNLGAAPTASPTFTGTATIPTLALTNVSPLPGVVDASNAAAGKVGEVITAQNASVALTTTTSANLASITLTPGDWDITGVVEFSGSASNITLVLASIGTTSATLDGFPQRIRYPFTTAIPQSAHTVPPNRFNVSVSTTLYLVGQVVFATGTVTGSGKISARRAR